MYFHLSFLENGVYLYTYIIQNVEKVVNVDYFGNWQMRAQKAVPSLRTCMSQRPGRPLFVTTPPHLSFWAMRRIFVPNSIRVKFIRKILHFTQDDMMGKHQGVFACVQYLFHKRVLLTRKNAPVLLLYSGIEQARFNHRLLKFLCSFW